jgi:predicted AAA+ superfamily ATPase
MKEIIKKIIFDFQAKQLPTFYTRDLKVPLNIGKIISVIGPRRSGKTWYLYQLMGELATAGVSRKQIIYINFEDERLDFDNNYDIIVEAWQELYPEYIGEALYFFYDEIQELPNWEKYVRRLYDTVSNHIIITGANSKMLSKEIATTLRGRSLAFEIMPLSFIEFLRFHDIPDKQNYSTIENSQINVLFQEYLLWGGYPELTKVETAFKTAILQEYFNVMIYRDLVERYKIKDVSILKYLIKRLIGSFSKEFSINKLYNELKSKNFSISKNFIYELVEQIFSVYFMEYIEKYEPSVIKRELTNKKIYLYDNGFASSIQFLFSEDRGKLLENLVFIYLRNKYKDLFFLKNGFECDFLVFPPNSRPLLIQVTDWLHRDNYARKIKGLIKAKQRIPDAELILLFNSKEHKLPLAENIKFQAISNFIRTGPRS